jgi:hypothetical protein
MVTKHSNGSEKDRRKWGGEVVVKCRVLVKIVDGDSISCRKTVIIHT